MLDKTGDEQVNFREFIVGVSPMITGDGEWNRRLHLSVIYVRMCFPISAADHALVRGRCDSVRLQ